MSDERRDAARNALVLACGLVFGFGLGASHMARPEVVLAFLQGSDLGLLFVMGGAILVAAPTFFLASRFGKQAPLTGKPFSLEWTGLDRQVVLGGVVFGVGWGLCGICPGAGYASLGIGNWPILYGIGGMLAGAYAHGILQERLAGSGAASKAKAQGQ